LKPDFEVKKKQYAGNIKYIFWKNAYFTKQFVHSLFFFLIERKPSKYIMMEYATPPFFPYDYVWII
jgi:adenine-specific DNA methylase